MWLQSESDFVPNSGTYSSMPFWVQIVVFWDNKNYSFWHEISTNYKISIGDT
jgi:hypothetical protein